MQKIASVIGPCSVQADCLGGGGGGGGDCGGQITVAPVLFYEEMGSCCLDNILSIWKPSEECF